MEQAENPISDNIEVVPVVVVSQTFPARPSAIPEIRDFVRRCLAQSPLSEEDTREVGQTVSQALLEAAGPSGAISVSFRIFPDHVEVDVLRSGAQAGNAPALDALTSMLRDPAGPVAVAASAGAGSAGAGSAGPADSSAAGVAGAETASDDGRPATSFAEWMTGVLNREGLTIESAARQLGVSVKTVSRWVGGSTEPRLRDLRRIHELFGEVPFP
jgi:helix-turn-helix protein